MRRRISRPNFSLTVPIRVVSEANQRDHWAVRARRVRQHRDSVRIQWLVDSPTGCQVVVPRPLTVTLIRVMGRNSREFDDDNLRGALKAVRDQVAEMLDLQSDNEPDVAWRYGHMRAQRHGVQIVVKHGI